jgi:hypothetical protein
MYKSFASKIAILFGIALHSANCFRSLTHPIIPSSLDQSSFANVDYIRTTDFNLTMNVYFDDPIIEATNTLTLKAVRDTSEIILDF